MANIIFYALRAAWLRSEFVCLWKLIGDCCTCLYDLDEEDFRSVGIDWDGICAVDGEDCLCNFFMYYCVPNV